MGVPFFFGLVIRWVVFYCGCIMEREGEDLDFWRRRRERVQRVQGIEEGPEETENVVVEWGKRRPYLVIVGEGRLKGG